MLFNYFSNNNVFNFFENIKNLIILHFDEMRGETPVRMHLHSHEYVEIFYILSGEGFFVTPEKTFPLKANDIVVVDSKKPHTEYSASEDTALRHYILSVDNVSIYNKSDVALLPQEYRRCFHHSFGSQDNPFYGYFQELYREFSEPKQGMNVKTEAITLELLIDLVRLLGIDHNTEETNIPAVLKAKEYIDSNFAQDISLDELAAYVFVSKYHLSRQFKQAHRCSPIQYLTMRRIQEAKRLLRSTNKSISEIARLTGFNLPVYFTKIFKQAVGITPHKYRSSYESQPPQDED